MSAPERKFRGAFYDSEIERPCRGGRVLCDLNIFAVTCKNVVDTGSFGFAVLGNCADHRHNEHRDRHGGNTYLGRLCRSGRETGCEGNNQCCTANGEQTGNNTGQCADLGDFLGE